MVSVHSTSTQEQIAYGISNFRNRDAAHLPNLFRRIYGDHYLAAEVYDPNAYRDANAAGTCRSLVAHGADGWPVGHLGILDSAPDTGVRELGQGVVDPGHRTQGLLGLLIARCIQVADSDPTCCGLFGAALTNHVFSQRALWKADFVDVGFEIGFVPARMMQIEAAGAGPTATVLQYRPLDDAPTKVAFLPSAYSDLMLALYDQLHLSRAFATSDQPLDKAGHSQIEAIDLPRFDLVRINVHRIGADLEAQVAAAVHSAKVQGRTMVQLALALNSPSTDAAVEAMRAAGFWFGALLPRWMGDDALLMQRAIGEPWFGGIELFTNDAKALLRFVQEDASRQKVLA